MGEFLKTLAGKIATAVLSLAIVAAGLAWWETPASTRQAILSDTGRLLGWLMLVLVVPWAGFWLVRVASRFDSNVAGAVLVLALTSAESAVLAWLFGWSIHGATEWVLYVAAILIGGVYNLFTCDWIAEKIE